MKNLFNLSLACLIAISFLGLVSTNSYAQVTIRATTATANSPVKTITGTAGNVQIGGGGAPNSAGIANTFVGYGAGQTNTTGVHNTFLSMAGYRNTTGIENTFLGYNAGSQNTTGIYNTSLGAGSGAYNNGSGNVFMGTYCSHYTLGNGNVNIGHHAAYQYDGNNNVVIGNSAAGGYPGTYLTGNNNILLGANAYFLNSGLTNATAIGYDAKVNASNKIVLGNSSVTVIEGQVPYSYPSDGRFKNNVTDNVPGLAFIKKLRPVTYQFDTRKFDEHLMQNMSADERTAYFSRQDYSNLDAIMHTGFIAQEVESAAKELNYSFDGVNAPQSANDNYSVAYSQFVVPLVKAVQEQETIIENQSNQIKELLSRLDKIETAMSAKGNIQTTISNDSFVNCQPNPTNGMVIVDYQMPLDSKEASVILTDLTGRVVLKQPITGTGNGSISLNLSNLPNAVYLYQLVVDQTSTEAKKIILSK